MKNRLKVVEHACSNRQSKESHKSKPRLVKAAGTAFAAGSCPAGTASPTGSCPAGIACPAGSVCPTGSVCPAATDD